MSQVAKLRERKIPGNNLLLKKQQQLKADEVVAVTEPAELDLEPEEMIVAEKAKNEEVTSILQ